MESIRCANGFFRTLMSQNNCGQRTALFASSRLTLLLALGGMLVASPALAQIPHARLSWVYPTGDKVGTSVDVSVGGTDLDDLTGLHFSHPGITAQVKTGPVTPLRKTAPVLPGQFAVAIAAEVPRAFTKFAPWACMVLPLRVPSWWAIWKKS